MSKPHTKILPHELISTAIFAGYLPIAPGTWGAWSAACLVWILCRIFELPVLYVSLTGCLIALLIGVYSSSVLADVSRKQDPSFVVIDEWAGMFLTYALIPLSIGNFFLGFILFRFFDIVKPWPARSLESLKGGWGIMLDDIAAGVYAALTLFLVQRIPDWL